MDEIIIYLLTACLFTCIIEIIPLVFVKGDKRKWISTSIICNVITNPIINILMILLSLVIFNNVLLCVLLILSEIAIIVFEAFLYYNIMDASVKKCAIVSTVCNFISFTLGIILWQLLDAAIQTSAGPPMDF